MGLIKEVKTILVDFEDGTKGTFSPDSGIDAEVLFGRPLPSDPEYERQEESGAQAASIPGWATWTEQESLDWIDLNVTDLDSAKQAIKAMTRMLLALRNKNWPNLEGS